MALLRPYRDRTYAHLVASTYLPSRSHPTRSRYTDSTRWAAWIYRQRRASTLTIHPTRMFACASGVGNHNGQISSQPQGQSRDRTDGEERWKRNRWFCETKVGGEGMGDCMVCQPPKATKRSWTSTYTCIREEEGILID